VLYHTADGKVTVNVLFAHDNFWLAQRTMADLFGVKIPAVNKHLRNIYASGELTPGATISKMETAQIEGDRQISREIEFYNLDAVIAVGYRVNSVPERERRTMNPHVNAIAGRLVAVAARTASVPPMKSTSKTIDSRVLKSQCIPMERDLWTIENAQLFWQERRKLLADSFNEYIQELFRGSPGKDDYTIRRIRAACARLRSDVPAKEEMISEIEFWADVFFSTRKWQQYPDPHRQIPCFVQDRCSWIQSGLDSAYQSKKSP
jgi:hypothetical protein